RTVEHFGLVRSVAGQSAQLFAGSIAKRVVPTCGVEPVTTLLGRDAHQVSPSVEQRRHPFDVGATSLRDLRPQWELQVYWTGERFHRPSIARSCASSRRQKSRAPAAG